MKPKSPLAIVASDWILHDRNASYGASPAVWEIQRVVYVGEWQVAVEFETIRRGLVKKWLSVIPASSIRACGTKALVARFRAACVRQYAPLNNEVTRARAAKDDIEFKAMEAVAKMRAKAKLAPVSASR